MLFFCINQYITLHTISPSNACIVTVHVYALHEWTKTFVNISCLLGVHIQNSGFIYMYRCDEINHLKHCGIHMNRDGYPHEKQFHGIHEILSGTKSRSTQQWLASATQTDQACACISVVLLLLCENGHKNVWHGAEFLGDEQKKKPDTCWVSLYYRSDQ